MSNLHEDALYSLEILDGAGDNESINGAGVDMQGYEGVTFIASALQGEAGAISMKAQQDIASDFSSDPQDLAGTSVDVSPEAAADGFAVLTVMRPQERYVRPVLTIADFTTPVAVSVVAVRFGARERPTAEQGEFHLSPDEGTA